jgi:hypothetical protein
VGWDDVEVDERQPAVAFRREMERTFARGVAEPQPEAVTAK